MATFLDIITLPDCKLDWGTQSQIILMMFTMKINMH